MEKNKSPTPQTWDSPLTGDLRSQPDAGETGSTLLQVESVAPLPSWWTVLTPWSTVGYLTYKRTYSRVMQLVSSTETESTSSTTPTTEEWNDTILRVIESCRSQLNVGFTADEEERLGLYLKTLKGTVAGRFLWQLGTETVDRLGLFSLQNCAFTVANDPVRPFTWAMDGLMLGSGVGVNVQREYVYKLPTVKESYVRPARSDEAGADFIVPDSREGWVELLRRTLESAFFDNSRAGFTYSTQLVRGKGTPIKGFGGVASGPEDLVWGIGEIGRILENRAGKQLRPIDVGDIICVIGQVVVAGNVRRSAIILIGDHDDLQYLRAKRWDLGNIPNYRAMSNNSVVCNDFALLPEEFWEGYRGNGEPYGLINLKLARSCGRVGETKYKDKGVQGFNPCAEQGLADKETCCLAEMFLPNITSREELLDVATLLYRVCKHSLLLPCHHPETEAIVRKNMRMGIGVTGYLQATEEQRSWLAGVYEDLRKFDAEYSKLHGMPASVKLTTVKPSGTLSLLPGVAPGVHPAYARHLIRRIRFASNSPIVNTCRANGYKVEYQRRFDGTEDRGTVVVEFPFSYPDGTTLAQDMSAIDQLKVIERANSEWSDNSVSCTVYYRKEELPDTIAYLSKKYNKTFKTLSFLLHSEHGFDQAPLEEITEEEYNELMDQVTLINHIEEEMELDESAECAGGACPIR